MNEDKIYFFLHKQIALVIVWALFSATGFTLLCYIFDVSSFALAWYISVLALAWWGWRLYRQFDAVSYHNIQLKKWYQNVQLFTHSIFGLWTILVLLYWDIDEHNLNQVTVLIQVVAIVIATTFVFSNKKIFIPLFSILIYPVIIYFVDYNEAKWYVLALFIIGFMTLVIYLTRDNYNYIQHISHQSQKDFSIELNYRRDFIEHMDRMLKSLSDNGKFSYLLLIDLDDFKSVNDTWGYHIGDRVLNEVYHRLQRYTDESKYIARIGGDELVLIGHLYESYDASIKSANNLSQKITQLFKEPYDIDGDHIPISASIGIKIIDSSITDTIGVIKEAETAMYEAKYAGCKGVVTLDRTSSLHIGNTLEMERKLYFALEHQEIELYLQPRINQDGVIVGCAFLAQWYHQDLGLVDALELMNLVEKAGVMTEVGEYLLKESFKMIHSLQDNIEDLEYYSIHISINQLLHEHFFELVSNLSQEYLDQTSKGKIIFEISEKSIDNKMDKIVTVMKEIKKLGITFSFNHFDLGDLSLNIIQSLPLDELKIDRSIVRSLGENEDTEILLEQIFKLSNMFALRMVAEGIENKTQFELLRRHSCNLYQGYYFDKLLKKEDFELKLLQQRQHTKNST